MFGIPVTAYVDERDDGPVYFQAEFTLDTIMYRVKLFDSMTAGELRLTSIVNDIIYYGAADLSMLKDPVIPILRNDVLTLEEAQGDPDFGLFMPKIVPPRFAFELARRSINQDFDGLYILWTAGLGGNLRWNISKATEYDFGRIVSVDEREKYDMSLYPIPWAESVPSELREYVLYPIFWAEDLTFDIVMARAIYDQGNTPGWQMCFDVLYGDVVISVDIIGMSPEEVWEMLIDLP